MPLRPEESSLQIFDAIVEAATYYLKEDIMNIIRKYLTSLKLVKYSISEDLQVNMEITPTNEQKLNNLSVPKYNPFMDIRFVPQIVD